VEGGMVSIGSIGSDNEIIEVSSGFYTGFFIIGPMVCIIALNPDGLGVLSERPNYFCCPGVACVVLVGKPFFVVGILSDFLDSNHLKLVGDQSSLPIAWSHCFPHSSCLVEGIYHL
jgi:hypothetical protein